MSRRERGFTLLEVLVAFTILALVIGGTLEVYSSNLRAIGAGEEYTRAASLARSKLDELLASRAVEDAASLSQPEGETDEAGAMTYRWRIELEPYLDDLMGEEDQQVIATKLAKVVVEWDHGESTRSLELTTLLLEEPE